MAQGQTQTVKLGDEKDSDEQREQCTSFVYSILSTKSKHRDDTWSWPTLVQACQRWRTVIFAWSHHLDLWLRCESKTAATKALDVWPTFPIRIRSLLNISRPNNLNGIIYALEHRDWIPGVNLLYLTRSQFERCVTGIQEPFPVLRCLFLHCCSPYSDDAPCVSLKRESSLVMSHSMPSRLRNIARQIRKEVYTQWA
jgi:hypothetical protein